MFGLTCIVRQNSLKMEIYQLPSVVQQSLSLFNMLKYYNESLTKSAGYNHPRYTLILNSGVGMGLHYKC